MAETEVNILFNYSQQVWFRREDSPDPDRRELARIDIWIA
jgi:hypothetical protein